MAGHEEEEVAAYVFMLKEPDVLEVTESKGIERSEADGRRRPLFLPEAAAGGDMARKVFFVRSADYDERATATRETIRMREGGSAKTFLSLFSFRRSISSFASG